jgi:hypothetical protein
MLYRACSSRRCTWCPWYELFCRVVGGDIHLLGAKCAIIVHVGGYIQSTLGVEYAVVEHVGGGVHGVLAVC